MCVNKYLLNINLMNHRSHRAWSLRLWQSLQCSTLHHVHVNYMHVLSLICIVNVFGALSTCNPSRYLPTQQLRRGVLQVVIGGQILGVFCRQSKEDLLTDLLCTR